MSQIHPNINWLRENADTGPQRIAFGLVGEAYEIEVRRVRGSDDAR